MIKINMVVNQIHSTANPLVMLMQSAILPKQRYHKLKQINTANHREVANKQIVSREVGMEWPTLNCRMESHKR